MDYSMKKTFVLALLTMTSTFTTAQMVYRAIPLNFVDGNASFGNSAGSPMNPVVDTGFFSVGKNGALFSGVATTFNANLALTVSGNNKNFLFNYTGYTNPNPIGRYAGYNIPPEITRFYELPQVQLPEGLYTVRAGLGLTSTWHPSYSGTLTLTDIALTAPIPEPETYALLLVGLGFIGYRRLSQHK